MAHPNIDERRAHVATLLAAGTRFTGAVRRAVAERFGCSPEAVRADTIALRCDRAESTIYCSAAMRQRILARDTRTCQFCGRSDHGEVVAEHVVPAALGGVAQPFNLVAACQSCNVRKRRTVWVPRNLDAITAERLDWRRRILELGNGPH